MLLRFLWPLQHVFPEFTLPHINQKKEKKIERNGTMEIAVITQKELIMNNETDFNMCTYTQT